MKKSLFLIYSLFAVSICSIFSQNRNSISIEQIEERIVTQLETYPQEKLHLHLDRDCYVPGEKIWFRAYLLDAATHTYSTDSRYVYVELINSSDSLISRVMIRPDEGIHYGHIFLSEVMQEGIYTIRAYTKYMENQGDDYFFKKNIYLGSLQAETIKKESRKKQKKVKDDFDVTFYPEGGNLLDETLSRIAFKALKPDGSSENISGEIVDENGKFIVSVKTFHAGMGLFSFIPEKDKKYFLNCKNSNISKTFELPKPISHGYSLFSYWRGNKLIVSKLKPTSIKDTETSYILMHNRGNILYFASWDNINQFFSFSKEQLPSGVIQILLLDKDMNPLSERLVFCKKKEDVQILFHTNQNSYKPKEQISVNIKTADTDNKPLLSSMSVSITDDRDITVDDNNTIYSSLLLSSELKGYIESPGYYFSEENEKSTIALDYLMLTHGWRRYNIPEVLKGNIEHPAIEHDTAFSISGTVKSLFLSKPIVDSSVSIFSVTDAAISITESDKNGKFEFKDFEHPDSMTFFVQSLSAKGSKNIELFLDQKLYPKIKSLPNSFSSTSENEIKESYQAFLKKAEERSKYDDVMRVVNLKPVEVVASKIDKEKASLSWYNSGASKSFTYEDIEKSNSNFVSDMLRMASGVFVASNGDIYMRGAKALIVIDGFAADFDNPGGQLATSPVESVPISMVERIDVFKGPEAAIFGMRGGNGVISITTKRGENNYKEIPSFNRTVISPLGYQKPIEFYSPKYDTPESKTSGIPDLRTTIFWKPNINTNGKGEASFDFYTSDFPTTYSIVIEGVSLDGKIIRSVEKISVE